MSEVRLVVRELERDWSGTIHGSCAARAVAALSADPVTMEDLEAAVARFAKSQADSRYFVNLSLGRLCDEPYDAGLVVIDLIARLVVVDSSYSSPGHAGAVDYHEGRYSTGIALPYHLAEDWRFSNDGENWQALAEQRRRERVAKPPLEARAVFLGRPMLEYVVRETFAAFARRDEIAAAVRTQRLDNARERLAETLREIHAAWLLTPRDDLGGACPRDIALERRDHVAWDLQDRATQWSLMDKCPPGLAESSRAFRYAGFGTHELVEYYNL
ncbi:MAG: hypothetical protein KY476_25335, partial [Planctomycetes bacterium]|nr:hypothetical protein [Planctomycetota bacterium]